MLTVNKIEKKILKNAVLNKFFCRFANVFWFKHRKTLTIKLIVLLVLGEIMEESAKKRGGRRPGAGRKKSTVKRYGFNAPATVHAVLQQVDSITDFICEAVLKHGQDKGLC